MAMAGGTDAEGDMQLARRVLTDVKLYSDVPAADLNDSRCTLTVPQTKFMLDNGMWEPISEEQLANVKGVCRVFHHVDLHCQQGR